MGSEMLQIQRSTCFVKIYILRFLNFREEEEGTRWKKGTEDSGTNTSRGSRQSTGNNPGWKKVEGVEFEQDLNLNLAPNPKEAQQDKNASSTPSGLPPLPPQKLVHDTPTVSTEAR